MNRPTFANIVGALSDFLQAMAGYLDIGAFGKTTLVERNVECRETLELVEEQSLCQASSTMASQNEATVPDETSV